MGYLYHEDPEEDEVVKAKYCKFETDPEIGTKCGLKVFNYQDDYCTAHSKMKCNCGNQAVRFCEYCHKKGIIVPLCKGSFCSADHNINKKHIKIR